MQFRLRTLLIALAIGPMILAIYIAMILAARDSAVESRTHKPTVTTRLLLPSR